VINEEVQIMKQRITWKRRGGLGQSGWTGYLNGRRLFTIERSITRDVGWVLRTTLPLSLALGDQTDEDETFLKVRSEELLTTFVSSLGAD